MLKRGDKGDKVKIVQQALIELGYLAKGSADGDFGPGTEKALVMWEQERYADAEVSDEEFAYFQKVAGGVQLIAGAAPTAMPKVPRGYDELIELFGKPWEDGTPDGAKWWAAHQAKVAVPAIFSFNKSDSVYVNKYIAPVVEATFRTIAERGLAAEVKTFDGCFSIRSIRGYEKATPPRYSTHTWGVALDINAAENGLGVVPKLTPGLVACFKEYGWVWGGDFKRLDGMHFQFCVGA